MKNSDNKNENKQTWDCLKLPQVVLDEKVEGTDVKREAGCPYDSAKPKYILVRNFKTVFHLNEKL